jgi:fatty acid desaturase
MVGLLQHGDLADNVVDYRLNTRTVFWNMNYHTEHHMYPVVLFDAMPRLHELVKNDLPAPNPSIWRRLSRNDSVLIRQLRDEELFNQVRAAPDSAPVPHLSAGSRGQRGRVDNELGTRP